MPELSTRPRTDLGALALAGWNRVAGIGVDRMKAMSAVERAAAAAWLEANGVDPVGVSGSEAITVWDSPGGRVVAFGRHAFTEDGRRRYDENHPSGLLHEEMLAPLVAPLTADLASYVSGDAIAWRSR